MPISKWKGLLALLHPRDDRALKYGRNVAVVSAVMVVLAWVPDIEIERFQVFGFDFKEGGQLSVWGILCVVLLYYFVNFIFTSAVDEALWQHKEDTKELRMLADGQGRIDIQQRAERFGKYRRWFDLYFPIAMFMLAAIAAVWKIAEYWPSN